MRKLTMIAVAAAAILLIAAPLAKPTKRVTKLCTIEGGDLSTEGAEQLIGVVVWYQAPDFAPTQLRTWLRMHPTSTRTTRRPWEIRSGRRAA